SPPTRSTRLAARRRRRRCGNGMGSRVLTTLSARESLSAGAHSARQSQTTAGLISLVRPDRAIARHGAGLAVGARADIVCDGERRRGAQVSCVGVLRAERACAIIAQWSRRRIKDDVAVPRIATMGRPKKSDARKGPISRAVEAEKSSGKIRSISGTVDGQKNRREKSLRFPEQSMAEKTGRKIPRSFQSGRWPKNRGGFPRQFPD